MSFAHSANAHGVRHELIKHLRAVADYAADFAAPFNASQLAHYLGLWHDLGKFHPDFQQYLLEAEQGKRSRGPDHKAAGVRIAMEHQLGPIALLLQGHHGGLTDKTDLQRWYERCKSETDRALVRARQAVEFEASEPLRPPAFAQDTPRTAEFFLRMLFSTLVDADFLDTEAHFAPQQSERRSSDIGISTLWQRFEEDHRRRFGTIPTSSLSQVNRSRRASSV